MTDQVRIPLPPVIFLHALIEYAGQLFVVGPNGETSDTVEKIIRASRTAREDLIRILEGFYIIFSPGPSRYPGLFYIHGVWSTVEQSFMRVKVVKFFACKLGMIIPTMTDDHRGTWDLGHHTGQESKLVQLGHSPVPHSGSIPYKGTLNHAHELERFKKATENQVPATSDVAEERLGFRVEFKYEDENWRLLDPSGKVLLSFHMNMDRDFWYWLRALEMSEDFAFDPDYSWIRPDDAFFFQMFTRWSGIRFRSLTRQEYLETRFHRLVEFFCSRPSITCSAEDFLVYKPFFAGFFIRLIQASCGYSDEQVQGHVQISSDEKTLTRSQKIDPSTIPLFCLSTWAKFLGQEDVEQRNLDLDVSVEELEDESSEENETDIVCLFTDESFITLQDLVRIMFIDTSSRVFPLTGYFHPEKGSLSLLTSLLYREFLIRPMPGFGPLECLDSRKATVGTCQLIQLAPADQDYSPSVFTQEIQGLAGERLFIHMTGDPELEKVVRAVMNSPSWLKGVKVEGQEYKMRPTGVTPEYYTKGSIYLAQPE